MYAKRMASDQALWEISMGGVCMYHFIKCSFFRSFYRPPLARISDCSTFYASLIITFVGRVSVFWEATAYVMTMCICSLVLSQSHLPSSSHLVGTMCPHYFFQKRRLILFTQRYVHVYSYTMAYLGFAKGVVNR